MLLKKKKVPEPHTQALMEEYSFGVLRFNVYKIDTMKFFSVLKNLDFLLPAIKENRMKVYIGWLGSLRKASIEPLTCQ